jgi:hypothetical protein
MTQLNNEQKQLIFDYCLGLTSKEETDEAKQLISLTKEAAETYTNLKAVLSALDSLEPESCPDDLAERTILRLNNSARASQLRLEQLIATEQARTARIKSRFWPNFGQVAAIAAVIIFATAVSVPSLNFIRQKAWQQQCQMQLSRIWEGINLYSSDHNGRMPAVATAAGSPWWKVGYKGPENHSNTRHIWLLVKGNYVNPRDFVCPGNKGRKIQVDSLDLKNYNDFPARNCVTYSFRIRCGKPAKATGPGRKVLMADLNPLFEQLPDDFSKPLKLAPNIDLLTFNSINHKRRGQNVLFSDGSIEFVKDRSVGVAEDDIFTLQDTSIYEGVEVPSCEADAFLAP